MRVLEDPCAVLLGAVGGVAVGGGALHRCGVVAAVRLDGRRLLLQELQRAGALPESCTSDLAPDSDLILQSYLTWGVDCVDHLQGDFSFAIWDRARGRLFCARDRVGAAPFYYHDCAGSHFAFASEVGALVGLPDVSRDLDELRVAHYLEPYFEDVERTFYASVKRLPPAHVLIVDRAGSNLRRYWRLDPDREVLLDSDEAYVHAFRECFQEAVADRLRNAERTGVLLSGGLDSACVLGAVRAARESTRQTTPLTTLSAVFPSCPQADEREYIDEALQGGGVDPCFVVADELSPLGALTPMYSRIDEPFHVPNLFIYWSLAREAQSLGIDTLLDGVDGDTTVSHGLEYLGELFARLRWIALLRNTRALARRVQESTIALLWRFGLAPLFAPPVSYARRPSSLLTPQIIARSGWLADRARWIATQRRSRTHRGLHHAQLTSGILPYYLEVNDQVAAGFGLDHSHPFYDARLMELCLALPADQRLRHGWDRRIQRAAAADWVSPKIRWRVRKAYWGSYFERSLLSADRAALRRVVEEGPGGVFEYVNRTALEDSWERCEGGAPRAQDYMNMWVTATLSGWLERPGRAHRCRGLEAALEYDLI